MDTIEQMRTFVAVADTGSFTKAGKFLTKSKALVSKHVGDLEERLGARLLNRTTRKVGLTDLGEAYLQRARDLLAEFEALEESVRDNAKTPRGRLKITAPQVFGELELMELVCAFQAAHPEIQPEIFLSDRVVDLVGEGFDVAIRVAAMPDSSLIVRRLCDVKIHICASAAYLARAGTPQTVSDLNDHEAIIDTNMGARETWRVRDLALGTTATVRPKPVLAINSALAVRQAALAGEGLAACPEFVVARDIAQGRLIEVLPGAFDHALALHLLYPHRLHLSARVRAFIDFTAGWYAQAPPWARSTTAV